jgi:hypothetical protein
MANTTNYNWETPDDTDLVKDGAAAIRTLGSSVDTTTKALNPSTTLGDIEYRSATANTNTRLGIGTTGQVLTVAGGVPTWATSDDANAIQNAIVDAKGDIVAASAADTPARLAVGTDNQRLVAASGEATGLKYVSDTQNTVVDAAGDLVYGTAADTLGRLAIGTAGQVLKVNSGATAPEWGAAGGASGLTLISSTTVGTAVSSVEITGAFSSTYDNYFITASGIDGSTSTNGALTFGATTSGYYYSLIYTSFTSNTVVGVAGANQASFPNVLGYNASNGCNLHVNVKSPNLADNTVVSYNYVEASTGGIGLYGAGYLNNTTQYTSFKITPATGTLTGGTIKVYGYQNS